MSAMGQFWTRVLPISPGGLQISSGVRHHEEAYEKADLDEDHLGYRRWRIARQGHDE